jgi:sugar phosphate isomerase/epimerase
LLRQTNLNNKEGDAMKLGYSTWGMPKLPVDQQVDIIARSGFTGIELVCIPGSTTDVMSTDKAERKRIRKLVTDAGLTLTALDGHGQHMDPDPEKRAAAFARISAGIEMAADLAGPEGTPLLVLMGYGKPETWETDRDAIADHFRQFTRHAEALGVTIGFEFHVGQAIDRPDRILWLLDAVGSPSFKLNHDVSHLDVMGYSIPDSIRGLIEHSAHTHIKDQRGRYPNHAFLTPGDGTYDYVAYLREMEAAGYKGYATVEISVMVQRTPGYDPAAATAQSYRVLTKAFADAGLEIG